MILRNCYLPELLLDWTNTTLNCDFDWTVTWLNCYLTELILAWATTLLNCDLNWRNCYLPELLLDWTVTWLICYLTELIHVLDWTVTWLNKYLIQMTLLINPRHTKYCACQEKLSWFILVAYETLFTLRAVTHITLQHLQILHLPQKVTFMIDPRHIWNVVYNARTNRGYPPTPPNTSPATKNASLKSKISTKFLEKSWNVIFYIAKAIWAWSDHDPSMKPSVYNSPRNATKSDPPTSPNTAPATKSDFHNWSSSHMKRCLQCADKQGLPSNITKYCACHENDSLKIQPNQISGKQLKRHFVHCGGDLRMIRPWSEHETGLVRNSPRNRGYFSRSGYHSQFHHMLHLPLKVTLVLHFSTILYSKGLFSCLPFSTLLDSSLLYYLFSTLLYHSDSLLYSTLLFSIILYSTLFYSSLLLSALLFSSLLVSSLLYSTLLYSTLFYSSLLFSTLIYTILLYSTLLLLYYSLTLIFSLSIILYSPILLRSTILDSAISFVYRKFLI